MAKMDLNTRYWYAGDGLGVPGLPHEISMQEAIDQGIDALLKGAIEIGSYIVVTPPPTPPQIKKRFGEGREEE